MSLALDYRYPVLCVNTRGPAACLRSFVILRRHIPDDRSRHGLVIRDLKLATALDLSQTTSLKEIRNCLHALRHEPVVHRALISEMIPHSICDGIELRLSTTSITKDTRINTRKRILLDAPHSDVLFLSLNGRNFEQAERFRFSIEQRLLASPHHNVPIPLLTKPFCQPLASRSGQLRELNDLVPV